MKKYLQNKDEHTYVRRKSKFIFTGIVPQGLPFLILPDSCMITSWLLLKGFKFLRLPIFNVHTASQPLRVAKVI